jgi:hypothetical protein
MSDDIKIEHIKITIGRAGSVELTMDEALQLKHELDKLFPDPIWKTIPPTYPVYREPPPDYWPWWKHGTICGISKIGPTLT